jgi:predicted RNase H-like HicB family nuclease
VKLFTIAIEFDPETMLYVGIIPEVPGAHTQGGNTG